MREQDVLEVELVEQAGVRGEELALRGRRIVHQHVGDEAEQSVRADPDDAVGEEDGLLLRQVERGLVRTETADLTGNQAAGQPVARLESLDGLARR